MGDGAATLSARARAAGFCRLEVWIDVGGLIPYHPAPQCPDGGIGRRTSFRY